MNVLSHPVESSRFTIYLDIHHVLPYFEMLQSWKLLKTLTKKKVVSSIILARKLQGSDSKIRNLEQVWNTAKFDI